MTGWLKRAIRDQHRPPTLPEIIDLQQFSLGWLTSFPTMSFDRSENQPRKNTEKTGKQELSSVPCFFRVFPWPILMGCSPWNGCHSGVNRCNSFPLRTKGMREKSRCRPHRRSPSPREREGHGSTIFDAGTTPALYGRRRLARGPIARRWEPPVLRRSFASRLFGVVSLGHSRKELAERRKLLFLLDPDPSPIGSR
jgi:hypothetical protein